MKRTPLALLLLAACTPSPHTGARLAALTGAALCYDPAALGAVPGDGQSDRVAIQAAIDAATAAGGGTVCLGPGTWDCDRAPAGSYNRFACLSTHGHRVTIRGAGWATQLRLAGDQGGQSIAIVSIDPGAEHVRIADLVIDSNAATNTDEQTHAIATSGVCSGPTCLPIRDVQIERVTFLHARTETDHRKGDCVRLLGSTDATRVSAVRIVGSDFEQCARSAIMIQRGVTDTTIIGNTFAATKTCIDGEATGGYDARITISGNAFLPGCAPAMSLTNFTGGVVANNTLASNLTIYRSTGVAVTGNRIEYAATTDTGAIDVANVCEGLSINGNTLARTGEPGPVIKLAPHSGGLCGGVAIAGNTIRQGSPFHAVYAESVSRWVVAGNAITYTVPAPAFAAIYDRSVLTSSPVTALAIAGNVIGGEVGPSYAVGVDCSPGSCGPGINVTGNTATNTAFGLRCNGPSANFAAPIVATGNAWGAAAYGSAQVVHGD